MNDSFTAHNRPKAIAITLASAAMAVGGIVTGFYVTYKIVVWLQT